MLSMRLLTTALLLGFATALSPSFLKPDQKWNSQMSKDSWKKGDSQAFAKTSKNSWSERKSDSQPHILFLLLDDLGWSEVGFNEAASISMLPTPELDALAKDGVVLKRHYVHKFCSPTRSALQSGRAPIHVNVNNARLESHNRADPVAGFAGIPRNMTGIAKVLQGVGYKTHMVGKWDVGVATPDHLPVGRGFDSSLIYFEHTNDCWKFKSNVDCGHLFDLWEHDASDDSIPFHGRPAVRFMNDEDCSYENQAEGCVFEDALFESRVTDIISKHDSATPLFLLWATHAVHGPYEPPTKSLQQVKEFAARSENPDWFRLRNMYYGNLQFIDESIGRVIKLTKDKGLYDNMFIVVSSDNGAVAGMSNEPLRGGKFTNFEGGIRAVSCVSGGKLPSKVRGSTTHGLIGVQDWYATFAALAGADPTDHRGAAANLPPVDSINVWPLLSGQTKTSPRKSLTIGTNAGGYDGTSRRTGTPSVGGLIKMVDGKTYKLLIGDADGKVECDMQFGPGHQLDMQGKNPDAECPKVTRTCGMTPASGCLFDLDSDEAEEWTLAAKKHDVFNELLKDAKEEMETVFAPVRNDEMITENECTSMESLHPSWLGPFLME